MRLKKRQGHGKKAQKEAGMKQPPPPLTHDTLLNALAALKANSPSLCDPPVSPSSSSSSSSLSSSSSTSRSILASSLYNPTDSVTRPNIEPNTVLERECNGDMVGHYRNPSEGEGWVEIRPGESSGDGQMQDSAMRAFAKWNWQREGGPLPLYPTSSYAHERHFITEPKIGVKTVEKDRGRAIAVKSEHGREFDSSQDEWNSGSSPLLYPTSSYALERHFRVEPKTGIEAVEKDQARTMAMKSEHRREFDHSSQDDLNSDPSPLLYPTSSYAHKRHFLVERKTGIETAEKEHQARATGMETAHGREIVSSQDDWNLAIYPMSSYSHERHFLDEPKTGIEAAEKDQSRAKAMESALRRALIDSSRDDRNLLSHQKRQGTRGIRCKGGGLIQNRIESISASKFHHHHHHHYHQRKPSSLTSEALESSESSGFEIGDPPLPNSGCGMPWNWSRIHSRGKSVLESVGGRSLSSSCKVSDRLCNRVALGSSWGDSTTGTASDYSKSTFMSDSDNLPLLLNDLTEETESGTEEDTKDGRKYRRHKSFSQIYAPSTFLDILGQYLVTQALSSALNRSKIAPVYIFSGPHGTGKTSCARIFSMALNCSSIHVEKPCGSCKECLLHKASFVNEFNATCKHCLKGIKGGLRNTARISTPHYKVFVLEECHALPLEGWNIFLKILEAAPRNAIFILITSNPAELPHTVISKCQRFLFSKVKEADVIKKLMGIAKQEGLDIDQDALRLVASKCEGSLRNAETMLDQLSLLGRKISLSMVQELVGLIPDEKLVTLLDYALSADTIHTVQSIKDLTDSGVEPLMLISQLATLITSILAGSYKIPKDGQKRKFFRRNDLTKVETERLRQALKTLSESEKQMRRSPDCMTWLTASLLQFAPDHSYLLSNSSADASVAQSPGGLSSCIANGTVSLPRVTHVSEADQMTESPKVGNCITSDAKEDDASGRQISSSVTTTSEIEDIWQRILDALHSNSLRKFLQNQGKLHSLSVSTASSVAHLEFTDHEHLARARRSKTSIAHAFYVTFGCQVDVIVTLTNHPKKDCMATFNSLSRDQTRTSQSMPKTTATVVDECGDKTPTDAKDSIFETVNKVEKSNQSFEEALFPRGEVISEESNESGCSRGGNPENGEPCRRWEGEEHRNSQELPSNSHVQVVVNKREGSAEKEGKDLQCENRNEASSGMHTKQKVSEDFCGRKSCSIATKIEEQNLSIEPKSGGLLCWNCSDDKCEKKDGFLSRFLHCGKSSSP